VRQLQFSNLRLTHTLREQFAFIFYFLFRPSVVLAEPVTISEVHAELHGMLLSLYFFLPAFSFPVEFQVQLHNRGKRPRGFEAGV
jgi:hypothetical protein